MFGNDKVEAMFRSLSRPEKYQFIMKAYEVATEPLTVEAKGELRRRLLKQSKTKHLEDSIGMVKDRKKANTNYVTARVGARKYNPFLGFHGHLIDAGTSMRRNKKGQNRGRVRATHFFTDAVKNSEVEVTKELRIAINAELEKMIKGKW